jgi:hypothetical protein
MTDEMMSFRALVEKARDADVLCEMIGFAAERLIGSHALSGRSRIGRVMRKPNAARQAQVRNAR